MLTCVLAAHIQGVVVVLTAHAALAHAAHANCFDSVSPAVCYENDAFSCSEYTAYGCRGTCGKLPFLSWLCDAPASDPTYTAEGETLGRLYQATGGAGWLQRERWANSSVSHCMWQNVVCDANWRVTQLWLQDNGLVGSLPADFATLSSLRDVDLRSNRIRGSLQPFSNHKWLQTLSLAGTRISSTISPQLANCTSLQLLNVYNTSISGTIPSQLGNQTSLRALSLSLSFLSGTLPLQVATAPNLEVLGLSANSLSGTIPLELGDQRSMRLFGCAMNRISGTISPELMHMGNGGLVAFVTFGTRVSGTIPANLGNLNGTPLVAFHKSFVSGTIPPGMLRLTELLSISLGDTRVSGTLPSQVAALTNLRFIQLSNTKVSGSIPTEVGRLTDLHTLNFQSSKISGSVPFELGRANKALQIALFLDTMLSGTLPSSLGELRLLRQLSVGSTHISGTMPVDVLSLSALEMVHMHNTDISGSIPWQLTTCTSLVAFIAHRTRISGTLPSFEGLTNMRNLTLFSNRLRGSLRLPQTNISLLFAQSNRLSCRMAANDANVAPKGNLLLPGNAFAEPLPHWLRTGDLDFQTCHCRDRWHDTGFEVFAGIFFYAAVVAFATNGELKLFFREPGLHDCSRNAPQDGRFQRWCAQLLLSWCAMVAVALVPLYYIGSNFYECGSPWLSTTMAYLSDDVVAERACAVLVCLSAAVGMIVIEGLKAVSSHTFPHVTQHDVQPTAEWSKLSILILAVGWTCVVCTMSIPSILYAMAASVPPNNTIGLSGGALDWIRRATGGILFVVTSQLIPRLSRLVIQSSGAELDSTLIGNLIMTARTVVGLIAPFVTVVVMSQDCLAKWLDVWKPCQEPGTFDVEFEDPAKVPPWVEPLYNTTLLIPFAPEVVSTFLRSATNTPIQILQQPDVCEPAYTPDGRCPRTVISIMGELLVTKLAFGAFIGPAFKLLLAQPAVCRAKIWVQRKMGLDFKPSMRGRGAEREMLTITMLFDQAFVLGVCVPILPLLAAVGLASNSAIVLWSEREPTSGRPQSVPPQFSFMFASLGAGTGLVTWLFWEARLSGHWVVAVGVPVATVCAHLIAKSTCCQHWYQQLMDLGTLHAHGRYTSVNVELELPLIDGLHCDVPKDDTCLKDEVHVSQPEYAPPRMTFKATQAAAGR